MFDFDDEDPEYNERQRRAIDKQARNATKLFLKKNARIYLEAAISSLLTQYSVKEVIIMLIEEAEILEEFKKGD